MADKGYSDLYRILDNLDLLVREKRRQRGLTLRTAAEECGVDHSTLHRIEGGDNVGVDIAMKILLWLGRE